MKPYVIDALCELASEQVIESRPALMVKGDGLAHQWRVAVVSRGEPVDLSGCSVAGYFIQNGEQTVRQPGVVSGNMAIVEIPDAVYGVSGPVDAFMRLTDATRKTTISMIRMTVREGATDVIIDPANKIPSIDELLMQIERLEQMEKMVTTSESARVSAENTRKTAESARADAEGKRATAETARGTAETARVDAEKKRAASETARGTAESARADAEGKRATAETARDSAETARVDAEKKRAASETARGTAEAARADAEGKRVSAETARGTAETVRVDAEGKRAAAETARVNAEKTREQAEAKRVTDSAKALLDAQAAVNAADGWARAEATAHSLPVGSAATASVTSAADGHKIVELGLPTGATGATGKTGATGRSLRLLGAWSSGTVYVYNEQYADAVTYNGSSYGCIKSHTASSSITPIHTTYWQLLASRGSVDNLPILIGATASAAGTAGLAPGPAAGAQSKYLRGDGTWQTPPNTTYSPATTSANGLMSAADKSKLDGVATGANKYAHPTGDGNQHVPATGTANGGKFLRAGSTAGSATWSGLEKADVTGALGYTPPTTNTTYNPATQSANGLMSSADKAKLDGVAAGANNYAHPTNAGNRHIPAGGASGQILRWSADGTAAWGADNNTTYSDMKGATASAAGTHGLVPAPAAGTQGKYLRGDGTWQTPPNTTYSSATQSANGLMSSADKVKLDGISTGADKAAGRDISFSVPVSGWTGSGPFTAIISEGTITERTKIVRWEPTEASAGNQIAGISANTSAGRVTLTTAIKPTGPLEGTMFVMEATG